MALRVAMLSRWHVHANEYCNSINSHDDADVVAIWDENPERGAAWARELDVPFIADYEALLGQDDIDAVCVVTPTNMHREIMVAAAQAGKHIFTEKVLATNVVDALAIAEAVKENNVTFCISFPRRCLPEIRYAKQAIDEGLLGEITFVRIRVAHAGASRDWLPEHFYDLEACGGGAMMDLGAHGMYLARWLAGTPKRVVSVFTNITDKPVEDNAVSVIEFESGAIAVNETSFVGFPDSYSLEVDGTKGGVRMLSPRDGVEIRSDSLEVKGFKGWLKIQELPSRGVSPINQWIDGCTKGTPIEFDMNAAVELTEIMETAYRSHIGGDGVKLVTN